MPEMRPKQQIIATYDTLTADRSPMDSVMAAINALSEGPQPVFVAVDPLRPYPIRDLGPPDWLIVSVGSEQSSSVQADWREVIRVAPQEASVVLLSQGNTLDVPREVAQHVDFTGWHGSGLDRRIDLVARRITGRASIRRQDDVEGDALRRGALIHVGDGTTILNPKLLVKIIDLGLSKGAQRVIRQQNIIYVGDLVQMTEAELLRIPDFGRKRLGEINAALQNLGLMLGAIIPGWPPENFEALLGDRDAAETLAHTPQAPSGEMFRKVSDRLAIDPAAGDQSDREVGASMISIQLQQAIRGKVEILSPVASRLGNQPGWHDLASLCGRLTELLDRPGADIVDVLGSLYAAVLELGSYAEMDAAARINSQSMVNALDPSAARPLQDVLTSIAPWLRRFPTIRELDDEAGRFLVAQTSASASREAFAAAAATKLIDGREANQLRALLDAGDRGSFLGGKAGRRGILSARNLVIAAAGLVVTGLWDGAVNEYAAHSLVARRAGSMLVTAENAVLEIAAEMPADVRSAIQQIITRARAPESNISKHGSE